LAVGQVEPFISFQARLTDGLGNPIGDGVHTLDFFIYDAAVGGSIVGAVLDVMVQTSGGSGIVSTSLGPVELEWFTAAPRFLTLTIDDLDDDPAGDELTPRIRLTSVPFALRAFSLDPAAIIAVSGGQFAGNVMVDGLVGIGTSAPAEQVHLRSGASNGILVESIGADTTPAFQLRNDAREWQMRVVGAAADQFDIRDATAGVSRLVIGANGNVGIGTTNPTARLHVNGDLRFGGNDRSIVTSSVDGADNEFLSLAGGGETSFNRGSYIRVHGNEAPGEGGQIRYLLGNTAGAEHRFYTHDGAENAVRMVIERAGNLGVGATTPYTRLHLLHSTTAPNSDTMFSNWNHGGGLLLENRTSMQNAVTGVGLAGGDAHGSLAGIGMVQEVANSLGALALHTGGSGRSNTVPERMRVDSAGSVGIGTKAPQARLHVASANGFAGIVSSRTDPYAGGEREIAYFGGWGAKADGGLDDLTAIVTHQTGSETADLAFWTSAIGQGRSRRMTITSAGNVGIGTVAPQEALDVNGKTRTKCLTITGGCDLAERFDVRGDALVEPGMVVVIDRDQPGQLRLSTVPYDSAVAGILSGAGGLNTGLTLSQPAVGEGEHAVALAGRVYCWCDATLDGGTGPIEPGDRLTTSSTPGHAMKVIDAQRAPGAVIGKAMSRLEGGHGLVLVLVHPQ
jgi:hypothetical protein